MSKFLNRLLGLNVDLQYSLFEYFTDTYEEVVARAKRLGNYEETMVDLTNSHGKLEEIRTSVYTYTPTVRKTEPGDNPESENNSINGRKPLVIEYHEIPVESGMTYDKAFILWQGCRSPEEGFYQTNVSRVPPVNQPCLLTFEKMQSKKSGQTPQVLLAISEPNRKQFARQIFRIFRPNIGRQSKTMTLSDLKSYASKVTPEEAKSVWEKIYEESGTKCSHQLRLGRCNRKQSGLECMVGVRKKVYHILTGDVISGWDILENKISEMGKFHLIRVNVPLKPEEIKDANGTIRNSKSRLPFRVVGQYFFTSNHVSLTNICLQVLF